MLQNETKIRVRYADTDKMGVVYHSNYAIYFEVGRTELFREIGLPYDEMEKHNIMLPLVNLNINYKKPAYYDEVLTVRTCVKEKPGVKIRFEYEIRNEKKELLCDGETTLVFIDMQRNRPTRIPTDIEEGIKAYF